MTAVAMPLRFQVGARTLAAVPRRLVRVALSLDEALTIAGVGAGTGTMPVLPPLGRGDHGYLVTSLPAASLGTMRAKGALRFVRQRYIRYHADLAIGFDTWFAGLSTNTRSGLKRKAKKLAAASAGTLDVRRYRTPEDLVTFHPIARAVSATTYQERLLGSGLPADAVSMAHLDMLAGNDDLRAWLLFVGDRPAAYLCCSAQGTALRYDHVGHDPDFADLSPGAVLQMEAMRDLFAERRFARFDFTEGEGQHKRQFATDGVHCVDLLLLRATPVNVAAALALALFDAAMAMAKRATRHPALAGVAKRIRR